jgi:hypothetical protein
LTNERGLVKKTKAHFKRNKDRYVVGGICLMAGGVATHFLTRSSRTKASIVYLVGLSSQIGRF